MNSPNLRKLVDPAKIVRILRAVRARARRDPDSFLEKSSGVIHVGANAGQERKRYARRNLDVLWIEPIPEIYRQLEAGLAKFPRQRALRYLVTDKVGETYSFNIASNKGHSSSIFDLALHRDIWPDIHYEDSIELKSVTLPWIVTEESIDLSRFDALVLDTQGSELLILQGAAPILAHFAYIKTEVADFESYKGGCTLDELHRFLCDRGFRQISKNCFARRNAGGRYYDVVYRRID